MKKLILGLLIIGSGAWAEFEVKMNIKALYRDSFEKLSPTQQNYIYDNIDKIQSITQAALKKETIDLKKEKFVSDKNIVEIILDTNGSIKEIKFISRSNERRFDNITKKVLEEAVKNFPKPNEPTPIRMIVTYEHERVNLLANMKKEKRVETNTNYIQRGTTRFEHSMGEQMREFETSSDGFINISANPQTCASFTILSHKNQRLGGMYVPWAINTELPKGKYKLLIQTKQTCNVNIQYP